MSRVPAPRIQYLRDAEAIGEIRFDEGLAAVEVPLELLPRLPLVNDRRLDGPRLSRVIASMRRVGYASPSPIICRIGMKGRWVVVDGGHRLTAAKRLRRSCLDRLLGRRLGTVYFLLFTTEGSWSKLKGTARALRRAAPLDRG